MSSHLQVVNWESLCKSEKHHKLIGVAHNQIHEQQNAVVKGDSGIIGNVKSAGVLEIGCLLA